LFHRDINREIAPKSAFALQLAKLLRENVNVIQCLSLPSVEAAEAPKKKLAVGEASEMEAEPSALLVAKTAAVG
jgi:hypothetical protein